MSVVVALDALQAEIVTRGVSAFLLTTSEDLRPHSVAVDVAFSGSALLVGAGRSTSANVGVRPLVSLLWPGGEFSLIVDGTASVGDEGIRIEPTGAVLHRGGASPACQPVDGG